ncbi:MAG TPA: MXAN_6640 family putative metalloprotease [Actinomycetota bacterium]|nr:MXAN_6640 family putative metalloprotease [Actinomycetota bacterium]
MLVATALVIGIVGPAAAEPRGRRAPPLAPAGDDAIGRALTAGRITEARYALERAAAVFAPTPVGRGTEPRLATMYLRDLAARVRDLSGLQYLRARRLLARPTGPPGGDEPHYTAPPEDFRRHCTPRFCVHWVVSTEDAPDLGDADANGLPDWIDHVVAETTRVWEVAEATGYRPPKSDATSGDNGGDGRTDIYVMNLARPENKIYGYCTTDDPNMIDESSTYPYFDASAYCVLDDDYAEYPQPGLPSLRVTSAHELFHAIQFAYDAFEDVWLMEGTAVWFEDEVYDDINDSYQFLRASHLVAPRVPLDYGDVLHPTKGLLPYGSFLFWRFLSEYGEIAGSPTVIRRIWERADASPFGPHPAGEDDYSLRAVAKEVAYRGSPFRRAFNDFGVANLIPHRTYEEGAGYRAQVGRDVPLLRDVMIRPRAPRFRSWTELDHLTTGYVAFRPARRVPAGARLRISVAGPPRRAGTHAAAVIFRRGGGIHVRHIRLDRRGDGALGVPFARSSIKRVVLVLSNGSTRFDGATCYSAVTTFSCGGARPLDENRIFSFRSRLRT